MPSNTTPSAQSEREQVRAQLLEALAFAQFDTLYCSVDCKPPKETAEKPQHIIQPYH